MKFSSPEEISSFTTTGQWKRLKDGRPEVSDNLLERMKLVTMEEAWGVLKPHGYNYQFDCNWMNLHPERVLVGRAVTASFTPIRPELNDEVEAWGQQRGYHGSQNNWVIQSLQKNDVPVVDMFGKIRDGTFVGDNLSTAVLARAGTGMVIDGGIRDVARIYEMPTINVFCRGIDPTPIRDVTLVGLNCSIRIGQATVLPGDVVLGTRGGVIFIPPHLAEEVVNTSEEVRVRDKFSKQRLAEGKYTSGQVDRGTWAEDLETDFQQWKKTHNF